MNKTTNSSSFAQPPRYGVRRQSAVATALFITALLLFLCAPVWAQPTAPDPQYKVKAVFLFNFAKFAQWPPKVFLDSTSPVTFGILGDDPFGLILEDVLRGEMVNNRKVILKRCDSTSDAKTCQVLFICRSESARLPALLAELNSAPVLTVSESDQFCQRGGMLNFTMLENKVKFEANAPAIEKAGLRLSSQLLNLARIVNTEMRKDSP